jgi:hypothetical protein
MKGDFSRLTFDRRKRYSGVLMQQGRVQTDADWNEQLEIQHRRTEIEARDVIGLGGVPKETGGFELQLLSSPAPGAPFDLSVSDGRIYVEGLLCESEASAVRLSSVQGYQAAAATLEPDGRPLRAGQWVHVSGDDGLISTRLITSVDEGLGVLTFDADLPPYQDADHPFLKRIETYLTQPDVPSPMFSAPPDPAAPIQLPTLQLPEGYYLAYLHVWERHITALDDPLLREKALGGPDTTTRIKNVWQVGLLPISDQNIVDINCESELPEWDALIAPLTGLMNARTKPEDDPKDPCLLPPEAGYRRVENQLYRVEVQQGGARDAATFKWSRENGSIQTNVEKINGTVINVSDLGRDDVLGFGGGQWVEVIDDESELTGAPRPLALIIGIQIELREITLDTDISALDGRPGLRLRRWDQRGDQGTPDGLALGAGWLDLEAGIQVQFSEGTYSPGDYWLIPARTATAEIEWPPFGVPNEAPQPQPPRGIKNHYCRLALVFSGAAGVSIADDCRKLFPPLTHICAEDVCFDNTDCQLPNAETVQDAIEQLCHERDLRFHNKHLHGWGIVCGLQVNCGPDEQNDPCRHVTVRKGYAIDCEGNDIIHEEDEWFDLITLIEEYDKQHPNAPLLKGDGEVCLVLNGDLDNKYSLEKYDPAAEGFQSIFKNTLWFDFLNDCLGKLVEFIQAEFSDKPGQSKGLVSAAQKRWTTLLNLLIQLVNKNHGRYVYLSGEKGLEDDRTEHTILFNLYTGLRKLLESHTFCGMFDDTQFPEYPYAGLNEPSKDPLYIPTIFGRGWHRRLRVHPSGKTAYTCGLGNKINVYDLVSNEMVAELKFPDDAAQVQDVAFSADGQQLYAIGTLNGKDSLFAVATINGTSHAWKSSSVICDVLLVTLATRTKAAGVVYAAGKGKGIYKIDVSFVQPNMAPLFPCNAAGHLVIVEKGQEAYAYATGRIITSQPNVYDHVQRYDLVNQQAPPTIFHLQINGQGVTGSDDIAVAYDANPPRLYVVTNPPSFSDNKHLIVFDARSESAGPVTHIDLEEKTAIRLAYNSTTSYLMVTYADSYRVRLVGGITPLGQVQGLDPNFRQPVQISPMSIAMAPDPGSLEGGRVYVLNSTSNTITSIPAARFNPTKQIPLSPLVDYRAAVLEAFVKLFGGLLQYLKDCLCDHLLVNCPECDEDDKIYLACIEIKGGSVYKICNFSKRKYVKSFPTVEYWLSAVPVLPLVGKAVEAFCCAVLPAWFGGYKASKTSQSPNTITSAMLQVVTSAFKGAGTKSQLAKKLGGLGDAFGGFLRDLVVCAANDYESAPALSKGDIVGKRVEDVQGLLRDSSMRVVGVEEYDPCNGLQNFAQFFTSASRPAEHSAIRLVVEDGTVRSYTTVGEGAETFPASSDDAGLRGDAVLTVGAPEQTAAARLASPAAFAGGASGEEVKGLREELAGLRKEFDRTRQEYAQNLASRDETVSRLEADTRELQASLRSLEELKQKLDAQTTRSRSTRKPKA